MNAFLLMPAIAFMLKDSASEISLAWLGGGVTVVCLVTFVLWILYAFFARRSEMDAAANLPFQLDDDGGAA